MSARQLSDGERELLAERRAEERAEVAAQEREARTFRDSASGRYAHSDMEALCVCGHPLGWHSAEVCNGRRDCFAADFSDDVCECERYRKTRRRVTLTVTASRRERT